MDIGDKQITMHATCMLWQAFQFWRMRASRSFSATHVKCCSHTLPESNCWCDPLFIQSVFAGRSTDAADSIFILLGCFLCALSPVHEGFSRMDRPECLPYRRRRPSDERRIYIYIYICCSRARGDVRGAQTSLVERLTFRGWCNLMLCSLRFWEHVDWITEARALDWTGNCWN